MSPKFDPYFEDDSSAVAGLVEAACVEYWVVEAASAVGVPDWNGFDPRLIKAKKSKIKIQEWWTYVKYVPRTHINWNFSNILIF